MRSPVAVLASHTPILNTYPEVGLVLELLPLDLGLGTLPEPSSHVRSIALATIPRTRGWLSSDYTRVGTKIGPHLYILDIVGLPIQDQGRQPLLLDVGESLERHGVEAVRLPIFFGPSHHLSRFLPPSTGLKGPSL